MTPFEDRRDAGQQLAKLLLTYAPREGQPPTIVFGLARGGVPVAFEVAKTLGATLDVFIVRKIGVPWQPELAMGAIASGGTVVVNNDVVRHLRVDKQTFDRVVEAEKAEMQRREFAYRGSATAPGVEGAICIVVDDGIATGASMLSAVRAIRLRSPARIIVAAPVASPSVEQQLGSAADEIVCLLTPADFSAVGTWYENFDQTTDQEVIDLLRQSKGFLSATR